MNARNGIGSILGQRTDDLLSKKPEELQSDLNDGSVESMSGDGRSNPHQVFAFQAVTDEGDLWFIPYGSLAAQRVGKYEGKTFSLVFNDEAGDPWRLTVTTKVEKSMVFQKIVDRISSGKRESIRPNLEISIKITEVKD